MSVSIGGSSAGMGPRHAMEDFGKVADKQPVNWRVSLRLLEYLRPHRARLAAALTLMLVASALTLAARPRRRAVSIGPTWCVRYCVNGAAMFLRL